jgi:murein DD-endopeptidase MepM/ murein hydrolase activator NlpD
MAGGDHLHFAMIVQGVFVNPVEWWDEHWIRDNVALKTKYPSRIITMRTTSLVARGGGTIPPWLRRKTTSRPTS